VLIDVAAAGINGADLAQRRGAYPSPAGAPDWPGLEVSGTVAQIGAAVNGFATGDRVCALIPGGGYAELVSVDERLVLPVPAGVDLIDAAGLPEVAATVWSNVFMLAELHQGQTLLVHGGSSGIGSMAIQLGVALGARVIATAGSDSKVAFCESLGAIGVNYREQDFVQSVKQSTGDEGANVVLNMVGGDYIARDIHALAIDGRIMVIANKSGAASEFDVGRLMAKRGRIWGTTLRARPIEERSRIIAEVREQVWPLIERGDVRPIVDSRFPLFSAADAHRRMESSQHIGKILLTV
jgi:putative PIG3 family NAD(P)H quinone oxidoreductase